MNYKYLGDLNRCKSIPPEVIVGHVEVFQCEQEVIKGLGRDFNQLVVVDDQVLQIDQTCEIPGSESCQAITWTHKLSVTTHCF